MWKGAGGFLMELRPDAPPESRPLSASQLQPRSAEGQHPAAECARSLSPAAAEWAERATNWQQFAALVRHVSTAPLKNIITAKSQLRHFKHSIPCDSAFAEARRQSIANLAIHEASDCMTA
jgi:hypothetical protein